MDPAVTNHRGDICLETKDFKPWELVEASLLVGQEEAWAGHCEVCDSDSVYCRVIAAAWCLEGGLVPTDMVAGG